MFCPMLFVLNNLPYSRPMDTQHCANLTIAHALLTHRQNISPKLIITRIAQITFS
jgi:hypothetical protein